MREGWTYKKLGEVCDIRTGKLNANAMVEDGEYPFFTCDSNPYRIDKYAFDTEAILISGNGSLVGHVNYYKGKFNAYQRTYVLDNFTHFQIPYLLSFLKGYLRPYIKRNFKGGCIPYITLPILQSFLIPLPPKSQQEAIVLELDEINSLLALKREQLQKYDKLAQSLFYEMFGDPVENEKGWEVKKIGEIGSVERGAGISKKDFVESGLPCIHYGQLHTCLGATTHFHRTCIPENLLPKYKTAHTGDVVMAITSEDVEGSCKSTAWLGNYDVIVGSDAAILHHQQNGVYISYCTQTKAFYNEKSKYAKGFKVTHISTKEIELIPIMLPPLSLQQQFASRIEQIESQKQQVQAAIEKLETLLASRMQYWFE